VIERELITDYPDDQMGELPMHHVVPRLLGTPGSIRTPAPRLGQHSRSILAEVGIDDAAYAKLASRRRRSRELNIHPRGDRSCCADLERFLGHLAFACACWAHGIQPASAARCDLAATDNPSWCRFSRERATTFCADPGAKLAPKLGTTIVVDNKPGAGGAIGAAYVAKSAPTARF